MVPGVGVLTFETVGKVPRSYNGHVMTHPIAIANAPTAGLGAQVCKDLCHCRLMVVAHRCCSSHVCNATGAFAAASAAAHF